MTGSGGAGPDGLALTADGGLVVAHIGIGAVWIFDRTGQPIFRVQSPPGLHTTNIAFGREDGRDLFITGGETGSILRAKLPVAGQPMYSQS
jgi:gluconolactonase